MLLFRALIFACKVLKRRLPFSSSSWPAGFCPYGGIFSRGLITSLFSSSPPSRFLKPAVLRSQGSRAPAQTPEATCWFRLGGPHGLGPSPRSRRSAWQSRAQVRPPSPPGLRPFHHHKQFLETFTIVMKLHFLVFLLLFLTVSSQPPF